MTNNEGTVQWKSIIRCDGRLQGQWAVSYRQHLNENSKHENVEMIRNFKMWQFIFDAPSFSLILNFLLIWIMISFAIPFLRCFPLSFSCFFLFYSFNFLFFFFVKIPTPFCQFIFLLFLHFFSLLCFILFCSKIPTHLCPYIFMLFSLFLVFLIRLSLRASSHLWVGF